MADDTRDDDPTPEAQLAGRPIETPAHAGRNGDRVPHIALSTDGWRAVGVGSAIFSAVCLIGLVAAIALKRADALADIALVLAIAAFVVQIIVSALQNAASRAAVSESHRLNYETNKALEQIKASAAASQ